MSKILILGATGSLGSHATQQAVLGNHEVSTVVRTPSKLPAEIRAKVAVHQADLAKVPASVLATILRNHDVVITTAGASQHRGDPCAIESARSGAAVAVAHA
jgi:putative NADH-flavin reductase